MSGFVEVYVPVWNPNEESSPMDLTLDIDMEEDRLDEISSDLKEALENYNSADVDEGEYYQSVVLDCLGDLLEEGLVRDASCDEVGISTVDELKKKLNSGEIEEFPVR